MALDANSLSHDNGPRSNEKGQRLPSRFLAFPGFSAVLGDCIAPCGETKGLRQADTPVGRREDCVTVTHLSAGMASRPSAIRVGTVPTGNRSEHCVHWRPGMASGTMPFLAATPLGCRPDRLLMAWDECHGAVGRREDCVTVTHLSAGVGIASSIGRGAVSGSHISRPRMDCALGGFLMTRDEHHGLGGRSLFWPGGNHLPDSRAGPGCIGVRCLHLAGSNSRDETVQSSHTGCVRVGLAKQFPMNWASLICTGYDRCTPICHHTLTSTCMTPVDVV